MLLPSRLLLLISLFFMIPQLCLGADAEPEINGPFEFDAAESTEKINETDPIRDAPPGINPTDHVQLGLNCKELPDSGNGTQKMIRFYFDASNSACQKFTYTGEGGNNNNFPTELDCLNDCYIHVGEGDPLKEEDDVIIGHSYDQNINGSNRPECLQPHDSGNCSEKVQSFYYLPEWRSCVSFIYSGCGGNQNRFSSRIECEEHCSFGDISPCRGPQGSKPPLKSGTDCFDTVCGDENICIMGAFFPECCNKNEYEVIENAYSSKCKNESQAGGHLGEYFVATFATHCGDLLCAPNEQCIGPNDTGANTLTEGFAKCCQQNKVVQNRRRNKTSQKFQNRFPLPLEDHEV